MDKNKKRRERPAAKRKPLSWSEIIKIAEIVIRFAMWLLDKLFSNKE